MSALEEAREQARAALELIHKWRQREQAWDTPRALDFERIGVSIRALLDATEPQEAAEPAGDEREALVEVIRLFFQNWRSIGKVSAALEVSIDSLEGAVDDLIELGEPRPITDEMVEAAARVMFDAPDGMMGDYTWAEMVGEDPSRADLWRADARAALEAAEEARR